ncbi:hypothetical protein IC615_24050 [Serratia ureilytica]
MDYRRDILLQVLEYMEKNIVEGLSVEKVSIISVTLNGIYSGCLSIILALRSGRISGIES